MDKKFVIWGCSGHAKVLADLIKNKNWCIEAFFDNKQVQTIEKGVPVYFGEHGFHTWLRQQKNIDNIYALVAIGGHGGADRIKIQKLFREAGLKLDAIIHPTAYVCGSATLGAGTQVLAQAVVAASSMLGDACIVNHKASVDHDCVVGAGVHLAPGATVCGCVTIENNVMVGANAVVLPRLKIGSGSIIGAGAVISKDVPPDSTIVGNPGRPIIRQF